jgi:hypothetical protein
MDQLSPNVKDFLKKNRIKVNGSNNVSIEESSNGGKRSDSNTSKRSRRSSQASVVHTNNNNVGNTHSQFYGKLKKNHTGINTHLLNVPDKKGGKTYSSKSGSSGGGNNGSRHNKNNRSLTPSSPAELRLAGSASFSDFLSSEEGGCGSGDEDFARVKKSNSGSGVIGKLKITPQTNSAGQCPFPKKTSLQSKLPDIEENKSIQAKNK